MNTIPVVRLVDWSVKDNRAASPYMAPEQTTKHLVGRAFGHPTAVNDGGILTSSPIKAVNGRLVTTKSGTVYRLGRIDPKYRAWLRNEGIAYDPHNPVRIVR